MNQDLPVNLTAVKNYGLKTIREIFAKPKNISRVLKPMANKEDAIEWFDKLSSGDILKSIASFRGKSINVKLTKDSLRHIVDDNTDNRWRWIHNFNKMISEVDEIYFIRHTGKRGKATKENFRFVTYFNDDKVRVVSTDIDFNVITAYEATLSNGEPIRVGILMYSKR